jgi:four helix bundle protein
MKMRSSLVFWAISMGSASELEYHLLLAKDLKLIHAKQYEDFARQRAK